MRGVLVNGILSADNPYCEQVMSTLESGLDVVDAGEGAGKNRDRPEGGWPAWVVARRARY
jgi:hypothetical protein